MNSFRKEAGLLVVLGILLLGSLVFVAAQDHFCQGGDPDIHGVYIDGTCYNCNPDAQDGICPEDYGAVCKLNGVPDDDCIYLEDAFWSEDGSLPAADDPDDPDACIINFFPGDKVYLVISSIGVGEDKRVNFTVRQYGSGDDIIDDTIYANVTSGSVVGSWIVSEEDWDKAEVNQFYFEAVAEGDYELKSLDFINKGLLTLNYTAEEEAISTCEDYTEYGEYNCTHDTADVSTTGESERCEREGCCFISNITCAWSVDRCITSQSAEDPDPDNDENCDPDLAREYACDYSTEEDIGDCDAGDQFFKVRYSSTTEGCDTWETQPIPCPAKLRVPFFGFYSIVSSISLIALIYVFSFLIKEKRK